MKKKYQVYYHNFSKSNPPEYETLIILGNPANKHGKPGRILKSRLDVALSYFQIQQIDTILVTGSANYNEFEEAKVQRKYLIENGIDEKLIIKEKLSKSTPDNALFSSRITNKLNKNNIAIVTSHHHKSRTEFIFKHYYDKFKIITPYPTYLTVLKNIPYYVFNQYLLYKMKKGDDRLNRK